MSHIVIHDDSNNVTQYVPFDDVEAAATFLEDLHMADENTTARLFALEEVQFAVHNYVKIEIGETAPTPKPVGQPKAPRDDAEAVYTEVPMAAAPEPADEVDPVDDLDTVEYVEAAMAPADAYPSSVDAGDEPHAGEPRRGLFGR